MNYFEPVFPVRCSDGTNSIISFAESHATGDGRIPVAFAFDDNLLPDVAVELLAGLLQLACPPEDESCWAKTFRNGMSVDELQAAFTPFKPYFELFGENGAFQDPRAKGVKEWNVEKLFHGSPGDQTRKHNKDFLGGTITGISIPAAMIAVYTYQAHAFAGGPGLRVSIAGGGPLRVVPDMGRSLFQKAWSCVLTKSAFSALGDGTNDIERILPWLSTWEGTLTTANVPASHLYMGTPRRLILCPPTTGGVCPITGFAGPLVTKLLECQNGLEYADGGFRHPLSAYKTDIDASGKLVSSAIRAADLDLGVAWRERAGLVINRDNADGTGVTPPIAVSAWSSLRLRMVAPGIPLRILAYGARCESAKVAGSVRGVQSVALPDPGEADERNFEGSLGAIVRAAEQMARSLRYSLMLAFFSASEIEKLKTDEKKEKTQKKKTFDIRCDLPVSTWWANTERYADIVTSDIRNPDKSYPLIVEPFLERLRDEAIYVFDETIGSAILDDLVRIGEARLLLQWSHTSAKVRKAAGLPLKERKKP